MRRLPAGSKPMAFSSFLALSPLLASFAVLAVLAVPSSKAADEPAPEVKPALPDIPARAFNLKDFGGAGDGKTMNTEAFRKAIEEVDRSGGGRLTVPEGVYRTGPITLTSKLELHLDDGAVIQAPDTFADYSLPDPQTLQSQAEVREKVKMQQPLISGSHLHDVAITGNGIIDGAGATWWAWSERASRRQPGRLVYPRQKMVVINGCERLHVEGVTLRNSPMFHLVPRDVTDLTIERVKFQSPSDAPNTDAIDPSSCTNVVIRDCDIDVGDDDVAIKSAAANVLIEDCRVKHGHGISVGSETSGGVHDLLVRRCTFEGTDNGIRLKSMRGAGGLIENVRYTEIRMKDVDNAIVLDLLYVDNNRPNFRGDPNKVPKIRRVELSDIKIENSRNAGRIVGLPDSPIAEVTLRNVDLSADKPLVLQNTDHVVFDHVSLTIRNGDAKSATRPIE